MKSKMNVAKTTTKSVTSKQLLKNSFLRKTENNLLEQTHRHDSLVMGKPWCLEFAFADGSHRLRDNKIRRRVKFILIAQHSNERLYHGAYMLNFCS